MTETLLLADDEDGIRKVLGISLTDGGYSVTTAENGEEVLRRFREHRSDVVLTDIKMPDMDGIELLQHIKAGSPDTEVVMFTGCGMDASTCERLFQGFLSPKGTEGTWIGLMMAKRIVDQHAGRILVQSRPGEGTTVIVRLPAVAAE